jgi:hypothetical protein
MRPLPTLLVTAVLLATAAALPAQGAPTGSAEAQVRTVVERYLHGLRFNDIRDFEAASRRMARSVS